MQKNSVFIILAVGRVSLSKNNFAQRKVAEKKLFSFKLCIGNTICMYVR